ncbi:MAG: SAM-dependent methyltransferase, partial [Acidimicrobiales bacterium]
MTRDQAAGAGPALVVVGTPIGNLGDLSPRASAALDGADVIACEDTRRTRALLSAAGIAGKRLLAVHEHNEAEQAEAVVGLLGEGRRVALVT